MPSRIVACLAALVAAATLTATPRAAEAAEPGTDPLRVTVDSITPGVIPSKGPIRVTGVVTNVDDETWTTVKLYSFIAQTPMTTQAELAAAVALPDDAVIGERVTDEEATYTVPEIAPGASAAFSLKIPRKLLDVTEQGVYWFGVQALGQGPDGRDLTADGRARSFLPLVAPDIGTTTPLPTAVVLPLRRKISYAADGSLDDLDQWVATLADGGRLSSLVDLGLSAESRAVTYLVDPALVDAVEQLAAGNAPRSLRPTIAEDDNNGDNGNGTTPSPSTDAQEPHADPDALTRVKDVDPLTAQARAAATDWLARLGRALPGHEILGLPYGDVDIAAAADHNPRSYAVARKRTGTSLAPFSLPMDPVVAAPGGYLDENGLDLVDAADTVLISDAMFVPSKAADALAAQGADDGADAGTPSTTDTPGATGTTDTTDTTDTTGPEQVPTVATDDGRRIVVTSTASTTGPGPGDARSALSLRQRSLAEAAVRATGDDPQPLVLMLPNDWNPAQTSGFFEGFDVDWLDLVPLGEIAARPPTPVSLGDLTYPRFQTRSELGPANFSAASDLIRSGDQLQNLLTRNDQVGRTIRDQALTTLSYTARAAPTSTRLMASASARWVRSQLAKVHIEAPPAVTMTGSSGRFTTTITNDLHQPVTVGLDAQVNQGIEISHPKKVEVPAADKSPGRARVLLEAKSPGGGIHSVKLSLTDTDGTAIGGTDSLRIRSLQVSKVIWLFLGAAFALLFAAIVFRLFKRIRAARRTPDNPDDPDHHSHHDAEEASPSAPIGARTAADDTAGPAGPAEPGT